MSQKSPLRKVLKTLASLKLAVVVILSLGAVTAWGTFVEARLDASAAQKLVYKSVWMYTVMGIFAINLIAVMIDRWPWQKKHTGFICAHIGILTLMTGALITQNYGVDGSMNFGIGDKVSNVVLGDTDFAVYASMDGSSWNRLFYRDVDFYLHPPTEQNPVVVELPNGQVKAIGYMPYAFREEHVVASENENAGLGLRFQLQNANVNMTDWLMQPAADRNAIKDLGPAEIILTTDKNDDGIKDILKGRNAIVLRHAQVRAPSSGEASDVGESLSYEIHSAREPGQIRRGRARAGDTVETPWMGMVLRVLKIIPHAREEVTFKPNEKPTPLTTAALQVDYNGNRQWMSLNSSLKLFSDQAVYVVEYANKRLNLGFDIQLKKFNVGRYQGTMRAASYESVVNVPGIGEHLISMNEPLKHRGYTFYQASFEEDERGNPTASILSVNRDPGRWIKYLGALLLVFGTIHLFYSRRKAARPPGMR
jgi:hypothetical protein